MDDEDPYATSRRIIHDLIMTGGSARRIVETLVRANLLLPDAHPVFHGAFHTWHYEDGHDNTIYDQEHQFPVADMWEPTVPGHHLQIIKVTKDPWHIVSWNDEPVDVSDEAKANPYVDPWRVAEGSS